MRKDSNAVWFVVQRIYKSSFEKNRGNFKYTSDTPFFQAMKNASVLINNVSLIPLSLIAVMTNRFTSADCIIECELCYNYILCFFASRCDSHFEGKRMLICSYNCLDFCPVFLNLPLEKPRHAAVCVVFWGLVFNYI